MRRLNELSGAVALAQLRKLALLIRNIREMGCRLRHALERHADVVQLRRIPDPQGDIPFETYCLAPDAETATAFSQALARRGAPTRRLTGTNCHHFNEYCSGRHTITGKGSPFERFAEWPAPGYRKGDLPNTENLVARTVCLTIGVLFSQDDIGRLIELVDAARAEVFGG